MNSARFALAALLVGAAPLSSQEASPAAESGRRWGIGVVINPGVHLLTDEEFVLFPSLGGTLLVPITTQALTLEPEIGLFRFSSSSTSGSFSSTTSGTLMRVGVGALFRGRARGGLAPYMGPRVGFIRSSMADEVSGSFGGTPKTTTTRTSTYIAFVAGAQYFFSPHFSLGGEAQLEHVALGDETIDPPSSSASTTKQSVTSTAAVAILRFFY